MDNRSDGKPALWTEAFDFWLLGGASILIWFALFILERIWGSNTFLLKQFLQRGPGFFYWGGILINTPHFLWSYKLAYGQGRKFVLKNWIQLIGVPTVLAFFFAYAYLGMKYSEANQSILDFLNPLVVSIGLGDYFKFYADSGKLLLGSLIVVQYTTLGWHYAKQIYGVSLFTSKVRDYRLSPHQQSLLKRCLFGVWFTYLAEVNAGINIYTFNTLSYRSLNWPRNFTILAKSWLIWETFRLLKDVVYRNFKDQGKWPPLAAVFAFASMYFWFLPPSFQAVPGYFVWIVPFFHCVQYICFTSRVEYNAGSAKGRGLIQILWAYSAVIVAGLVFYNWLPEAFDRQMVADGWTGPAFFGLCAYLTINIHHYFIDSAIWRADNPEVRKQLAWHIQGFGEHA